MEKHYFVFSFNNIINVFILLCYTMALGCETSGTNSFSNRPIVGGGRPVPVKTPDDNRPTKPTAVGGAPSQTGSAPHISKEQAIRIALGACNDGGRHLPKGTPIEVNLKDGIYTVTFIHILPPSQVGPDYLGKIEIDAKDGNIIAIFAPNG